MSLGGTLLVALIGGSAGSGLTLAGGLKLQRNQQRFEHERWIRTRMADAVASFGAARTVAHTVLSTVSWNPGVWDQECDHLVAEQIATAGQELVSVHVAFGADSTVTAVFRRVHEVLGRFDHKLRVLQETEIGSAHSEAWNRAHDEYEASGEQLNSRTRSLRRCRTSRGFPGRCQR